VKISQRALISFAALLLSSCSPPEIAISTHREGTRQVVELSQDWGIIFSKKRAPCVDRVDLTAAGQNKVVWRIEAKGQQCVDLRSFVVGETPSRFVQRIPLDGSLHGSFDLLVSGIGMGEAQIVLA